MTLAQPLKHSMVGKFSRMPRLNEILADFKGVRLVGAYEIRWLDYKHILIHLKNEHDLNRLWTRQVWFIANQKMRVFTWSPNFQSEKESSLAPPHLGPAAMVSTFQVDDGLVNSSKQRSNDVGAMSTQAWMEDSWRTRSDTQESVENDGNHDFIQWAVENIDHERQESDKQSTGNVSAATTATCTCEMRVINDCSLAILVKEHCGLNRENRSVLSHAYVPHANNEGYSVRDQHPKASRLIAAGIKEPWLARGEFNVILSRDERLLGADPNTGSMEDFAPTLLDCCLIDEESLPKKAKKSYPTSNDRGA
ncbi:Uncharacterized protein TCM_039745 [Theobroma cacao]|uniref:DUF4283 domain-containing protein n=1 Tax=Theobroma cacao TaxID=3641 RepID=A0A061GSR4_THECC|nr:Uncharacterized protein TCM_039745 [Theobroma cacao]